MARESDGGRGGLIGHGIVRELGGLFVGQLRDAFVKRSGLAQHDPADMQAASDPPVVAQLMIEIRSDGSRTVARGALNDLRSGESAQLRAEGNSPSELMLSLASSLLNLPSALFKATRPSTTAEQEVLASNSPEPPAAPKL